MKKFTQSISGKKIDRSWYLIDAKDKVLGRIATEIAQKLMGKSKPYFVRNMDCGDNVVVINGSSFVVTGKKENNKQYQKYSGYPSGLKEKSLAQIRKERPEKPIRSAVYGMLPKNKLRDKLITRLFIYPDANHPHQDKLNNK
ncbi:50S ribosomal protein L13 [Patescibacteria group bacterium]